MIEALLLSGFSTTPGFGRSDLCDLICDLWLAAACASLLPRIRGQMSEIRGRKLSGLTPPAERQRCCPMDLISAF
jgi:hypothetical protein